MCKQIQIQQGLGAVCIILHKKPKIEKDERQVNITNETLCKRERLESLPTSLLSATLIGTHL